MNRRSTALIVILSLLAIFVTNTLAQDDGTPIPDDTPPAAPEGAKVPPPLGDDQNAKKPSGDNPGTEAPSETVTEGLPEGTSPGNSGVTYPVIEPLPLP
ncbi:Protein CBG25393 [Caenorhabditis briggsae]|uniref:Protein CBG25393 n=1 Tax=Caenorhabditis briggsae TaxID=6238 RepID=B6ILI2_CAEBR|nr:Protein CBG25393 [Caenorhabditis briggsae]CAS00762.1 Protein CBG25393 [Caenorhabditis briggsae]